MKQQFRVGYAGKRIGNDGNKRTTKTKTKKGFTISFVYMRRGGRGKGISEIIKRNISINKYMIGMQIRRERKAGGVVSLKGSRIE